MYADVLINHNYSRKQRSFTYAIPEELDVQVGHGVVLNFNNKKTVGLVLKTHKKKPDFKTKDIETLVDEIPLLSPWQIELAQWICEYYFCSIFDAIRLMLPKHIWRVPKKARKSKEAPASEETREHLQKLKPNQAKIVQEILSKKHPASLIHGITGAGKTEIYKHLIHETVGKGKQAILLVPEIALTPQLVKEYEESCTEWVVIHSRVSDGKRAEAWKKIREGKVQLVIGSRSALFSPFKDLGLIIMDEEHEWCYKQDQSPRYHARDVALQMVKDLDAQLVLGSATPSIESMWKAEQGEYALFQIHERISGTALPNVEIADMREELKGHNFSIFSNKLEDAIQKTLDAKEQVLLFLNRRGAASSTVCRDCGQAVECPNCDVKMTYHSHSRANYKLICHHCGTLAHMPDSCTHCGSARIRHFGIGTQKVEQELEKLFPTARIFRADRDSMSAKGSYRKLHDQLEKHEIDILVGTQMIAKGLDIPKVSLVGVMLADLSLHIPDFRSSERNFQLLTQVAGRAGRRETQGEVVIQTYNPEHPAIQFSQTHDFHGFYEQEISTREAEHAPPFGKIVKLIHVSSNKKDIQIKAQQLKEKLDSIAENHEIFSAPALIPRINNKYYWHILIQGPNPRKLIQELNETDLEEWRIDVDPVVVV